MSHDAGEQIDSEIRPKVDRDKVMRRDFFRLRNKLQRLDAQRHSDQIVQLEENLQTSMALRRQRAVALSKLDLTVNATLPVAEEVQQIRDALTRSNVVIVAGETGSGKTTQLPKILLQMGLGVAGSIAHTQPRRLAARTVARRMAQEMGTQLGEDVGFAVRFSDQVKPHTLLKVLTDGLLLTEVRSDRFLNQYDAIIIDEAHERSLNIDFLLGFLKQLSQRRRDLKIIITSATIDVERFSEFFNGAPIVSVGGRSFPVEVLYRDPTASGSGSAGGKGEDQATYATQPDEDVQPMVRALQEIETLPRHAARDVLVFLAGEQQIFHTARKLRKVFEHKYEILPLYARLSFAEQAKIFETSSGLRRVILATNVAETSLTVPNIGFVIDPGFARINRYSYRSKLQRLPIEPVSRASADQRKGRCGRVAPGVCIRLYDEQDYLSRPEFTDAEIHRVNLASVVLQMLAFNLGEIQTFDFIDPPDPRAIRDAMTLLNELQAIEFVSQDKRAQGKGSRIGNSHAKRKPGSSLRLTKYGDMMARMPIDPRLARMVVEAQNQGALRDMLVIGAALAVQDPRERPVQKADAADNAHSQFVDDKSDFLTFVKLWSWLEEQRAQLTRNRYTRVLQKNFVNPQRVQEWREVHRQLRLVCRELGFRESSQKQNYAAIHSSILSGSLSLVGLHDERGVYLGARGLKLRIFPGSGVSRKQPKWLVAAEIAETSRVYARNVAMVEPAWIEKQSGHLQKHSFSEPFWSINRGEVQAYKSTTLYGLRLVERRAVSYANIDSVHSRDLFIREAMVAGQVKHPPNFLHTNQLAVAHVLELEAKGRRRDLLISDEQIYEFYDQRIPPQINRLSDLNKWLKKKSERDENLIFDPLWLFKSRDNLAAAEDFPSRLSFGEIELELSYRFAPGEVDDGVTIVVPVGLINAVNSERLAWGVPGFLGNIIEQWLRTLPKQKRKNLVPLPEKVDELVRYMCREDRFGQGRLLTVLAGLLRDFYKVDVSERDWDRTRIATHLLPFIKIVDNDKVLLQGRDLVDLVAQLRAEDAVDSKISLRNAQTTSQPDLFQNNLTGFPAGELPAELVLSGKRGPTISYPGLQDDGGSVSVVAFASPRLRDQAQNAGYARAALLHLGKVSHYFRRELDKHTQLGLHFTSFGSAADLKDEVLRNAIWYCFFESGPLPRTADSFAARLNERRPQLAEVFNVTVSHLADILALRFACNRKLETLDSVAYTQSKADIEQQLQNLVPKEVLAVTPSNYLGQLPRYLAGIERRLDQLPGHVPRDRKLLEEVQPLVQRLDSLNGAELFDNQRYQVLKFYVEELRLKLFAEPIAQSRGRGGQHPLDSSLLGPQWKASTKRVSSAILAEEQRLGLA